MICQRCFRRFDGDQRFCPHDGEALVATLDVKRVRSKPTPLYGTLIGDRYQIRGQLGEGGIAKVYVARDEETKEVVAVKILEPRFVRDARIKARFLLEAKAVAKIAHPAVVEVLDVGLTKSGVPFLVLEFLGGESLAELLRREGAPAPERTLATLIQIAEGLEAAHGVQIIHRDLKPSNILLVGEKGSGHTAKILDFGFAKLEEHSLTLAGMTVGTAEYMAPEQTVSDPVDARTDVYGLGALAYRVLSDKLLFKGAEAADVLAQHLVTKAPALDVRGAEGAKMGRILARALAKVPANRYPTMSAMLADLRAVLAAVTGGPEAGPPKPPHALKDEEPAQQLDVYAPQTPFARQVATMLYKRLGLTPPAWA